MKHSMFAFIGFLLVGAFTFHFADEMGGGAGSEEENTQENGGAKDETPQTQSAGTSDDTEDESQAEQESSSPLTDEEIAAARDIIAQREQESVLSAIESSIKERVPNFDMEKVAAGLKKLNDTDPKLAAYYNASEAGLEMFYRDKLANVAQSDSINVGSHAGNGGDFSDVLAKARAGDRKSVKIALAQAKA